VAYVATALSIGLSTLLFVLTATGRMDIYTLWVITAFVGIVSSAFQPVRMSLIPSLVPRELLSEAVAAQSIVFNVSRFMGPALAGIAISTMGLASAFALNAISYFAMIAALLLVKLRTARSGGQKSHFFAELHEGITYTLRHPTIRQQLLIVAVSALFGRAVIVMLPAFAGGIFDGSSSTLATLTSVSGAGAVVAGICLTRLGSGARLLRSTVLATVATGVLMVGLGATQNYAIAIALVAVLGFALTLVGIGSQSLIQTQVREAMRGRVLSLWAAVAFSAPAIGSVVIGSIADRVGLGPTTFFSGLLCSVLAILLTWRVYHTSSVTRLASDHRSR
jgi:MFS family permease